MQSINDIIAKYTGKEFDFDTVLNEIRNAWDYPARPRRMKRLQLLDGKWIYKEVDKDGVIAVYKNREYTLVLPDLGRFIVVGSA